MNRMNEWIDDFSLIEYKLIEFDDDDDDDSECWATSQGQWYFMNHFFLFSFEFCTKRICDNE